MVVKAKQIGFYGGVLRHVGTVFEIEDPKDFSKTWMLAADEEIPEVAEQKFRDGEEVTFMELVTRPRTTPSGKPAAPPAKGKPETKPEAKPETKPEPKDAGKGKPPSGRSGGHEPTGNTDVI